MRTLLLVEFDDERSARIVEQMLRERFGLSSSVLRAPLPEVRTRGCQLDAEDLLSEVCRLRLANDKDVALGLTNQDTFVPELNFVFGLASADSRCAVVSTSRLRHTDASIYSARVLKESMHELGHTQGLRHCPNPFCVMHFSNSLEDTDRKSYEFCTICATKVRPSG
ncbi:MAG: archaemetzincin family Zn-dependent metalloprotease [Candidatus Thermoplasmatota archaeon]|nr:archaemetzincin family Zn-dependent metalloprotease [Candidatus Thermoplasmatota archaeon]